MMLNQDAVFLDVHKLLSESGFQDWPMSDLNRGVFVMHNKYALAACCILPDSVNNVEVSLQSAKEDMHNLVRKILLSLESQRGIIIDGYLLIILSKEPNSDVREVIQELEQDTKVCRKHVLWPSSDGTGLERAQYVTILSLPKPLSGVSQPMSSFSLSTNAERLLLEYKQQGNLDRLMDSIKNGVLRDADR